MNYKLAFICSVISLSLLQGAAAATITNRIQGVGPVKRPVQPYFCIQNANGAVTYPLAPGASINGNQYSGNAYYVGGSLRLGGCDTNDTYLGYASFLVNDQHQNSVSGYTPPTGVHIAYTSPSIDGNGVLGGKIQYKAIEPNFHLTSLPPRQNPTWDFVGINLSGLEFGKSIAPSVIPNLSEADAMSPLSDLAEVKSFINMGINTVRLPLSWGFLQLDGAGLGEINQDYYQSYVKPLLQTLTSAHVYAMVDLHAYMRYSEFGQAYSGCGAEGACPDGVKVLDPKAYVDVWTKLVALMKADSSIDMNYIMLDLVNEPVDVDAQTVFSIQAQVIKALRQQGYQGYILVEGTAWTGLHAWTESGNASAFSRENFAKAGINDLSKIMINVHQYLDSDYSGTKDQCSTNLNSTGPAGYNLEEFAEYLQRNQMKAMITEFGAGNDQATCRVAITGLLNFMKDHSARNGNAGFVGWTIWSAGHGWGHYRLRVTPDSYQVNVLQKYL